jgi:hypothetical protein
MAPAQQGSAMAPSQQGTPVVAGTGTTQAPALSSSVRDPNAQGSSSAVSGIPTVSAVPVAVGSVHHPESGYTLEEKAAATVLSTLITELGRGGLAGPTAAALLEDGTTVFSTSDGLGFVPHGTRLPENTIPLSEFPSIGTLFRTDMTGCTRPGNVLKLSADLGLIPPVRAIVATDSSPSEGITVVSPTALVGAPYMSTPVTRDLLSSIAEEDVPLALESLKQEWGFEPEPTTDASGASVTSAEDVVINLSMARWDLVNNAEAVTSMAEFMLTDAQDAVGRGDTAEAAYVLRQLLYLTGHRG